MKGKLDLQSPLLEEDEDGPPSIMENSRPAEDQTNSTEGGATGGVDACTELQIDVDVTAPTPNTLLDTDDAPPRPTSA